MKSNDSLMPTEPTQLIVRFTNGEMGFLFYHRV